MPNRPNNTSTGWSSTFNLDHSQCFLISMGFHPSVQIKPAGQKDSCVVTRSNFKNLYWTLTQQLAQHTINGCNLRPGDLLGTGTISGPEQDSLGCLLELTWNGQKPLSLNGTTRSFLEDGDEVTFIGCCKGDGYNVGFGTCTGKILPAP
ncbi:hypothetical protein SLEP1_g25759 [Rubroshorea leprosula]|uniref:Fumarylacetoacetase n=1 Tax=Rubroshorea leprosula TaxID=152421 RepID=A0AAV5JQI6_9ROSI|nr:hypothetical protein SLEP1_g25759 [Rubroshorea leprosula]